MPARNPSSGRTQQGYTPSPSPAAPGQFRPPARQGTARPAARAAPAASGKQQAAAQRNLQGHLRNQQQAGQRSQRQASQRRQRAGRVAAQSARAVQRETGHGSFAPYQAIILAEFILAELLVAATPIATRKNTPGLSPYAARDMTKLLAIGLVYFLLELAAVTGTGAGRFGAWFGGLILLTVGLGEAAGIVKDLDIFGAGNVPVASGPGGGQGGLGGGGSGSKQEA